MLLEKARDEYVQAVYSARRSTERQQDRAMLIAERKVKDLEYQYYSELRQRDIRNLKVYKERSNQMTSQVLIYSLTKRNYWNNGIRSSLSP